jgi:hypothetical protein
VRRTVAASADADHVDEHVDAPLVGERVGDDGGALLVIGRVGDERGREIALLTDRARGLLCPIGDAVHTEHLCALPGERRGDRSAVADRVARRLAGTDHHRHESGKTSLGHRPIVPSTRSADGGLCVAEAHGEHH